MAVTEFQRAYDLFKPRKAMVIATRPGEVRVRIHRDDSQPARWFPTVFASTPVGTEGVLMRVNREESLFIPVNVTV